MARIVIVGGSGFIGTRLINLLKAQGETDLLNVDIAPSKVHPDITKKGDVRRLFDMLEALSHADTVVLLAAQHRDDVRPASRYYETNVDGMSNVLKAMSEHGVRKMVFISSVSVYGHNSDSPDEAATPRPTNDYGRSKWQAEQMLHRWHEHHPECRITVVRPTVVFGEDNRGNVYNLLHQIQGGRFLMVGRGTNIKSMAYVGNVAAFVNYLMQEETAAYQIYNYVDKPDYDMNHLVGLVGETLHKHIPATHFPLWLGLLGGYAFDALSFITRRQLTISSQRIRKFCATTQFSAHKALATGFQPPYPIEEALKRTLRYEFG